MTVLVLSNNSHYRFHRLVLYWLIISGQSRVTDANCATYPLPVIRSSYSRMSHPGNEYKYANGPPILHVYGKAKTFGLEL